MQTIHKNWLAHFKRELSNTSIVRIISPFIGDLMVDHLLKNQNHREILLITRFNLNDFRSKVSSLNALERLLNSRVKVVGIKDLHSKAYVFDNRSAIITSANFTSGGFITNREFGIITTEFQEVEDSISYFNELWKIGENKLLSHSMIRDWRNILKNYNSNEQFPILSDEGASCIDGIIKGRRYFVKFYGRGNNRSHLHESTKDEVIRTHCHFALTFPKTKDDKRPRQYRDGDIVFIARMINGQDYAIFGRAVAKAHVDSRDVASTEDIELIDWKKKYSIYIRVHCGEFLDTTFGNCPRLQNLMSDLKEESFLSTKRKMANGKVDVNPKASLMQKAHIELSEEGAIWLEQKFEEAKNNYPLLSDSFINSLYQGTPEVK